MRTYITGATGRLGRSVFKYVNAIPLVRKNSGLKWERVTDFSREQLRTILKDADAIIHLAGSTKTWDTSEIWRSNVVLTRNLAECSPSDCHIVLASSVSVYGKKPAQLPAGAGTMPHPDSVYAISKREAERIVSAKTNNTILRIGTLYGPQFEDYFTVMRMIEEGRMKIFGEGDNHVSFVHAEDVARIIPRTLENMGTYVLAGPAATQKRVYELAADALGVSPPQEHVPVWMGMLAAQLEEFRALLGEEPRLTKEHISILSSDRVFDCHNSETYLGFSPRGIEEGIREMAVEYRKMKKRVGDSRE